ncbi:MAG: GFA family protein, partial [Mesorhizobium sp.]
MASKLTGKCFCGAVHYEVADEFLYAANCHCS